jgi:ribosomal protein S18 acetylase RimI-like enzyme
VVVDYNLMVSIRRARTGEVNKLQALNDAVFADNSRYDQDAMLDWAQSKAGETYFTTAINNPEACFLVAEDEGKLVGYIAGSPKKFDDRMSRYVEIDNLGVSRDYRRHGVGKKLMETCLKWAKDEGFQKVHLRCYSANVGALEFYKHNGFQDTSVSLERRL